ncbi:GNAT family N-acetyltransferase [Halomonas sp. C22]|uniref:GNAT family N-acetyltransferase n=1 Tax=Halomonas sp. C22 TaxID=2580567 RepID=UPI0011A18F2C|nr:GNAT family N-acetyltransferase [Halomonas sp. C22]
MIHIGIETLEAQDVVALLEEHLADMHATSPPESVHALDVTALKAANITFYSARQNGQLLGCAAIKALGEGQAELKSMRTTPAARQQGVGARLLTHVLEEARARGYHTVYLETGSMAFFEPARRLYARLGFEYCGPFGSYRLDPNSCFMRLCLKEG